MYCILYILYYTLYIIKTFRYLNTIKLIQILEQEDEVDADWVDSEIIIFLTSYIYTVWYIQHPVFWLVM